MNDTEADALWNSVGTFVRSTDTGTYNKFGEAERVVSQSRTSQNAWCRAGCEDHPMVKPIIKRIEDVTGAPYDNSENYYTYLEMTDKTLDGNDGNRAESKVFDNGGSNITALPFTSTPVPLLNDDAGIIQGFYNDTNARTEIHVEGNVMDVLAPAKYAIEVYEKGTSHQQSPDISYDDWSNYNLIPNTVTDIVTNIGQTTDSSRIVENKTYTITLHAMNSLALHANVSLDVSLAEEDPVIRLQHLQYFAADSTIRADIHFTDNLSDAHVYGALFNEPFANVTVAQNFFDSNTSNTNIQKKQNVFNESFTFVFDRFYNVSTSSWVTSVSETSVYYMYVYARENRAENQNIPATKIRTCAFGPSAGSFSVAQGTLLTGTENTLLLDGHPALVSAFTTTPSVLTTMVDNYLLVNIWIYPTTDAVGEKIVETADFVLSHDATAWMATSMAAKNLNKESAAAKGNNGVVGGGKR